MCSADNKISITENTAKQLFKDAENFFASLSPEKESSEKEINENVLKLITASNLGYGPASQVLGQYCELGLYIVDEPNLAKAKFYYEKAKQHGYQAAEVSLKHLALKELIEPKPNPTSKPSTQFSLLAPPKKPTRKPHKFK